MAAQGDGAGAFAHSPGHVLWQPNILNGTGICFQIPKFAWWDWLINWLRVVRRGLKSYYVTPAFSGKWVNVVLLHWNTWSFLGFLLLLLYSPPTAPVSVGEAGGKQTMNQCWLKEMKKDMHIFQNFTFRINPLTPTVGLLIYFQFSRTPYKLPHKILIPSKQVAHIFKNPSISNRL